MLLTKLASTLQILNLAPFQHFKNNVNHNLSMSQCTLESCKSYSIYEGMEMQY